MRWSRAAIGPLVFAMVAMAGTTAAAWLIPGDAGMAAAVLGVAVVYAAMVELDLTLKYPYSSDKGR